MNNYKDTHLNDEIDLVQIIASLWRAKYYIIFCIITAVICTSWYLRIADSKYNVTYKLKSVVQESENRSLSGFSGIASLAGIQLPSSSSSDFNLFKELLYSVEASQKVMENKGLIRDIFHGEWNKDLGKYSEGKNSKKNEYRSLIKSIITGIPKPEYIPPNSRRLANFISKNIQLSEDSNTGFLHLNSTAVNPRTIVQLMIEITNVSDGIIRERYIAFSKGPLDFYKSKLSLARSREHREALAQLISKEEQKLMLASSSKYFVAEPYIKPLISLYPVSPKPSTLLAMSLLFGLVFGSLSTFAYNYIAKG